MRGRITTILIAVILASVAYLSMNAFYANMVYEYSDVLNFSVDPSFNATSILMDETLNSTSSKMTVTNQEYLDTGGGTDDTSSDKMILNSFKVVKDLMKTTFSMVTRIIPDTARRLNVDSIWVTAFIAIILIVVIVAIVAGFMRVQFW